MPLLCYGVAEGAELCNALVAGWKGCTRSSALFAAGSGRVLAAHVSRVGGPAMGRISLCGWERGGD